ncbi:MAG: DNA topoisomerase 4 subunit A, partial [Candidatus Pacebacteria bacterium]|nr:DNA topoisomerase 4 subunit A [Candidatus Paceibacterota bacterium]
MEEDKKNKISPISPNREITEELKESFLSYSMSVIIDRALPDVRDGLKPVHRRILWAMWDSGLNSSSKLRKSANVVGEVLGRYHPHGDLAVYDAMARLAQNFSLRYPLIQGQGNWGSIDGDSPAAMRYTECRMGKIAEEMLFDIEKETVDWKENYDSTRLEPKVLPAKIPQLLINGTMGIAVGMATAIPPHNLSEVIDATTYLIDNPKSGIDELVKFVKGPDFPTGGIIYNKKDISEAYITGRGAVTTRALAEITERKGKEKSGQFDIVISEIPYQVNKSELIRHIAELVIDKRIEGIKDVRDESDKDGLRIVIELKNDVPPQKILNQLFKHTDLQKNFNFNMIALVDGQKPELLSLKEILEYYIAHRVESVTRRTRFELKKAKEREHILLGLAKALSVIDKVIATIKKSKNREDASINLIKNFKFSEIQTNAILDMRLQSLAALERQKIEDELAEKKKLIARLEALLKSPAEIRKVIKNELLEIKERFGDERRTKVVSSGVEEFSDEDLIPEEEAIITFSASG